MVNVGKYTISMDLMGFSTHNLKAEFVSLTGPGFEFLAGEECIELVKKKQPFV